MSTIDRLNILKEKLDYKYIDGSCYFSEDCLLKREKEIERLNSIIFNQNKRNSHQRIANDNLQNKNKELNNIINKGIEAINVYQNEKTLSVGYQDLKRIRGILQGNEFDLQMFEEYLQELKGSDR